MRSISLFTPESDILEDGMSELKEQMKGFSFLKNTIGLLFVSPDCEQEELMPLLKENFDFPILGATSMAMLAKDGKCHNSGLNMLVMTADDCQFHLMEIEDVLQKGAEEEISEKYHTLCASLSPGEEPGLLLCYCALGTKGNGDEIIKTLDRLSGGVPVYGGSASDSFTFKEYGVFTKENFYKNGFVLMMITGNIRPVFSREYEISKEGSFSKTVTRSCQNIVYELEHKNFMDVLKENGLCSENEEVGLEYVGMPFLSTAEQEDGTKIRVTRMLTRLHHEDRTGYFLGAIPEGAVLGSAIVNKEDLTMSVEKCFRGILERIQKETDYEYTTFLVTSCGGRYLWLATNQDAEAAAYAGKLPEESSVCGMYSFGEFAPVEKNGKRYNMFHNGTLTVLAI